MSEARSLWWGGPVRIEYEDEASRQRGALGPAVDPKVVLGLYEYDGRWLAPSDRFGGDEDDYSEQSFA